MNIPKERAAIKPFITSRFKYCLLFWMIHSAHHNRININRFYSKEGFNNNIQRQ